MKIIKTKTLLFNKRSQVAFDIEDGRLIVALPSDAEKTPFWEFVTGGCDLVKSEPIYEGRAENIWYSYEVDWLELFSNPSPFLVDQITTILHTGSWFYLLNRLHSHVVDPSIHHYFYFLNGRQVGGTAEDRCVEYCAKTYETLLDERLRESFTQRNLEANAQLR